MQKNHFELLGIEPAFAVNTEVLASRYRQLQKQFHPDRYVTASPVEQRQALEYATAINEAYHCLKNPISRAGYLLKLFAPELDVSAAPTDPAFLFQQMEWREGLARANSGLEINNLYQDALASRMNLEQAFERAWTDREWPRAADIVNRLQFVSKFEAELQSAARQVEKT